MFIYKLIHRATDFDYMALRSNLFKPRKLLLINNFVMGICALALFGFAVLVCVAFYQSSAEQAGNNTTDRFTSIYNWIGLALAGLGLSVLCVIGMRGAHLVSIVIYVCYV